MSTNHDDNQKFITEAVTDLKEVVEGVKWFNYTEQHTILNLASICEKLLNRVIFLSEYIDTLNEKCFEHTTVLSQDVAMKLMMLITENNLQFKSVPEYVKTLSEEDYVAIKEQAPLLFAEDGPYGDLNKIWRSEHGKEKETEENGTTNS